MILYPLGAGCFLEGQPLPSCALGFTYPPAFALVMVPFVPMPMWARTLIWYLISIALLYGSVRLGERLVVSTLSLTLDDSQRWWLRAVSVLLGLKFMFAVLENQAYDHLVFFLVVLGVYGLAERRDGLAVVGISLAAALKATPLIFLPYLLLRRKWKLFIWCALGYAGFSLLPDLLFWIQGRSHDYYARWLQGIVVGTYADGSTLRTTFGGDDNQLNQSLHSFVHRIMAGLGWLDHFQTALYVAYAGVLLGAAWMIRTTARLERPEALDGSALLIAMLMLSPMSSKSHFVATILPSMVVVAYLIGLKTVPMRFGLLLGASFALNSLTSRSLIGTGRSTVLLSMGCVTAGTLLLGVLLGMVAREVAGEKRQNMVVTRAPGLMDEVS